MAKKEAKPGKGGRVKKVLMTIAIAIILAFFVGYAVYIFYPDPKYEDFCSPGRYALTFDTKDKCESVGGNWTDVAEIDAAKIQQEKMTQAAPASPEPATGQYLCTKQQTINENEILLSCVTQNATKQTGWCDPEYTCRKAYDDKNEFHSRMSFIILAIIGLIVIVIATVMLRDNVIGYGLLAGGILTLLYGTIRFWPSIPDNGRLVILGIVLVTLLVVAWKRLVK